MTGRPPMPPAGEDAGAAALRGPGPAFPLPGRTLPPRGPEPRTSWWDRVVQGSRRSRARHAGRHADLDQGGTTVAELTAGGAGPVAAATPSAGPTRRHTAPLGPGERAMDLAALVLSVLAVLAAFALPVEAPAYRGLVLLAFWLYAPGAALVSRLRLARPTAAAVVPLVGVCLLTGTSLAGAWTGLWAPRGSLVLAAGLTAAASLRALPGGPPAATARWPRVERDTLVLLLGLAVPLGLWAVSLPAVATADPSVLGLLVSGSPTFPAALLSALVVLLLAVRRGRVAAVLATTAVLVLVLRTTASVVNPVPVARWTYKHIGVVDALQRYGEVQDGADIYMNWPGMFAAAGYFGDTSGVAVIDLARWIAPVVHVVLAVEVAALARVLGADRLGAATAAALVVVLNWVGQDYFAPQAVAMWLAVGFLVLLLQARTSPTCGVLALLVFAVIVPTHQLTPFWLLGLAGALALLRRTPWWVTAGMAAAAVGYVGLHFDVVAYYGLFSGFDVFDNATSNVPTADGLGYRVGSLFARANAVLLWGSVAVVLLVRARRLGWRRGWRDRDLLVLAALVYSPFALLAGQNYGGEAILRVTLYSTVGACAVLGPALARAVRGRTRLAVPVAVWALVFGITAAQSAYTTWFVALVRPEDVAAASWLAEQPSDSVVLSVLANTPGRAWADYVTYAPELREELSLDVLVPRSLGWQPGEDLPNPVPLTAELTDDVVAAQPTAPTFLVFTESMRRYDEYYGAYAPGAYQELLDTVGSDPDWRLVRQEGDLRVFESTLPGRSAP